MVNIQIKSIDKAVKLCNFGALKKQRNKQNFHPFTDQTKYQNNP